MRLAFQDITAAKGYKVVAIVDRDREKQGMLFFGTPIISLEELFEFDKENSSYDCVITVRTLSVVRAIQFDLLELKNASVYTFEEYFLQEKLNCNIYRIPQLQTHVVDHCNLNCVRCTHLSPLVKCDGSEYWLDVKEFEKDVARISELTNANIDEYQLAGGEPLLHPQCYVFPYIIKKYLPNTRVIIVTNGTMFGKVSDLFYKSCIENDVQIWVTRYPVNIDYDAVINNIRSKGIDIVMGNSGNSKEALKEMWGIALHPSGGLDGQKNFEGCPARCFILRKGHLFLCAQAAFSDLFNNFFNTHMPQPEENGVNIHKIVSIREATEFLSQKVPFCDYCNTLERMDPIPWTVSKCDIREWVDKETINSLS